MNEITKFNFEGNEVRTVIVNNQPWWVLVDVCKVLGLTAPHMVAGRLDEEDRSQISVIDKLGRSQETTIVNESGLYAVIIRSDKPEAKTFKRWVTKEVLPSIRKHGAYMTDKAIEQALTDPDFIIRLATNFKEERELRKKAEAQIEADKHRVIFAQSVEASIDTILIREMAKLICDAGVKIGQNKLYQLLREKGHVVSKGTEPAQYAVNAGLLAVMERTILTPKGTRICLTTVVTGKGQTYYLAKVREWLADAEKK